MPKTKKDSNRKKTIKKIEVQKNNYKLVLILITIILVIYFIYKGICLYVYNQVPVNYSEYINWLNIKETLTLNNTTTEEDYLTFSNIKIRNDFKDFEKISEEKNSTEEFVRYKKDINGESAAITIGKSLSIIDYYKEDATIYASELSNFIDLNDLLKRENINTDLELFEYLYKNKDEKINIFTSTKKMKEYYTKRNLTIIGLPQGQKIIKLTGNFEGYIWKFSNNAECHFLKDNKTYIVSFYNLEYFTDEYIEELLNTIIIS